MSESCNSRHFSWLMKSCLPNPSDAKSLVPIHQPSTTAANPSSTATTIASLPDDLLLECLSRVPSSSIPSLSAVCRRWSRLLLSPYFLHLRRRLGLLRHSLFAISAVDSGLFAADLQFQSEIATWKVSLAVSSSSVCVNGSHGSLSHARAAAIGPRIYIVSRNAVLRYDSWMGTLTLRSRMLFPRKKFAIAVISGKIYVAGGGGGGLEVASAVEEYDPVENRWEVVTHAARKRYGCIGAAVDGIFYVIGGLKIGNETSRAAAHVYYASSMDLFDVESRQWLRSRSVPGGGCVVAACAAVGHVYVLSSHAVELSFWRFDARRRGGNSGFGEWRRLKSPPLPAQVRLDGTVRFSCVGVEDKVAVVQVVGCIDDLLRRSGRSERGLRESLVLLYDTVGGEWRRAADLPEMITRAACACVEW
ncbi:F-box/kelch-repeat protein [Cardamine amara subsp. amara]|uniref:F-box/kelch-repeat protein n=1 Tax=Cardamine amara subsp. amara TaxID=228776 RepID=A0ABD1B1B5_CARAN